MATDPIVRVLRRIDINEPGCWLWPGSLSSGYGTVWAPGTMLLVHRVTYEYFIEDIPPGLELDHLCRTKVCCNPVHLEVVTHQVNAARRSAEITHCPQMHPYDEANTWMDTRGYRQCRRGLAQRARERRVDNPGSRTAQ